MIIRDEIDEARRAWARFAAIEEAVARATTAQVREALSAERLSAYDIVHEAYRYGRHLALTGCAPKDGLDPLNGLALAGWCDAQLERLRGGR